MIITLDEAIADCDRIAHKLYGSKEGADHAQLREWLKELKSIKELQENITPVPFHDLKCKAIVLIDDMNQVHAYLDGPSYLSSVLMRDTNFFRIKTKMPSDSDLDYAGQWKEIHFQARSIKCFSYVPYEQEDK